MDILDLTTIITSLSPWLFMKVMLLTIMLMYIVLAAIIIRQIHLMGKAVYVSTTSALKLISYAHFTASILIFLLALILL